MAQWHESRRLKLKKHSRWQANPGNLIFVADMGAVRFEYPRAWVVLPGEGGSILFHDRQPPEHHAILQLSQWRLMTKEPYPRPMPDVDWSSLPLLEVFLQSTGDPFEEGRELKEQRDVREHIRPGLEAIWRDRLMFDLEDQRDVLSRTCMARGANVTALISFDFYADEATAFEPVWDTVFGSLVLGQYVKDPTTGF